jgi:hypothetical protein
MHSSIYRPFEPLLLCAMLLGATMANGCASKANPVLPSTGEPHRGGLASGASEDGGGLGDARAAGDVAEVAADLASSNGDCDLLTYVRAQKGCSTGLACYPISGSGKCLVSGNQGAFNPCVTDPNAALACAEGLACTATPDMGPVCLLLCDPSQPACGLGYYCVLLNGFTDVGVCKLLPS